MKLPVNKIIKIDVAAKTDVKSKLPFKVGEIVYESYMPQTPGKIVAISDPPGKGWSMATVKFKKETKQISLIHLKSLQALIDDHEKKLNGHKQRLKKAQATL